MSYPSRYGLAGCQIKDLEIADRIPPEHRPPPETYDRPGWPCFGCWGPMGINKGGVRLAVFCSDECRALGILRGSTYGDE